MKNEQFNEIGLVKWFRNESNNANYGFIEHSKLGDLFFHERNVEKGQDLSLLKEGAIVIFKVTESKKHKGKLEAVNLKNLRHEPDLIYLLNSFIELSFNSDENVIDRSIKRGLKNWLLHIFNESIEESKLEELYLAFKKNSEQNIELNSTEFDLIIKILDIGRSFFTTYYENFSRETAKNLPVDVRHKLWLNGYLYICQIDYIKDTILTLSNHEILKILTNCSDAEKNNIFFGMLFDLNVVDSDEKLTELKEILSLSKIHVRDIYEKILQNAIGICPAYYKLNLWLEGYHDELNFDTYKIYTATLSNEEQKLFVKKVMKHIHDGVVSIPLEDFTSLNVIDYETSKIAFNNYNLKLDYSTSIILNIITELNNKIEITSRQSAFEAQSRIFDIVKNQIKDPKDLLEITGFFDSCEGRCSVSVEEKKDKEGNLSTVVHYKRDEKKKPRNRLVCDGRKAIDPKTKLPLLSNNVEYWWCANQKCYSPSRKLHTSSEWKKYTLLDFLTILNIDFQEQELEIYLNIINKANRFLKHLKCRECSHILYPKGKSAYAFWGVNNFMCKNEACSKKDIEIYISHCFNGQCGMEIDSRDSVKCKPDSLNQETCGWYVCNNCHSCCGTKQLEQRKWVYDNMLKKTYNCHSVGHLEQGILSCNKCGDSMLPRETDVDEYMRILEWFITNREKSPRILKSGKNKFDKWWFLVKKGEESYEEFEKKLVKYAGLGFQIPDIDIYKDTQLISEPIRQIKNNEIFVCKNCEHILDLTNEPEKAYSVKNYHKKVFEMKL